MILPKFIGFSKSPHDPIPFYIAYVNGSAINIHLIHSFRYSRIRDIIFSRIVEYIPTLVWMDWIRYIPVFPGYYGSILGISLRNQQSSHL